MHLHGDVNPQVLIGCQIGQAIQNSAAAHLGRIDQQDAVFAFADSAFLIGHSQVAMQQATEQPVPTAQLVIADQLDRDNTKRNVSTRRPNSLASNLARKLS